jgi:hypothetical protein
LTFVLAPLPFYTMVDNGVRDLSRKRQRSDTNAGASRSLMQKKSHHHEQFTDQVKTMADLRQRIAEVLPQAYKISYTDSLACAASVMRMIKRISCPRPTRYKLPKPSDKPDDTPAISDDLELIGDAGAPGCTLFQLLRGATPRNAVDAKIQMPLCKIIQYQPWYNLNKYEDDNATVKEFWTSTVTAYCAIGNTESRAAGPWSRLRPFAAFFPATDVFVDKWFRCLSLSGSNTYVVVRDFVAKRIEHDSNGRARHRSISAVIGIEAIMEVALMKLEKAIRKSRRAEVSLKEIASMCVANIRRPKIVDWCDTDVAAVRQAIHAREYLFDLCARTSCLIAIHSTLNSDRSHWRWLLRSKLKDHEIDGLASTWVASMSDNDFPRAGVFFDCSQRSVLDEHEMLMIAVLVSAGVSVWIRWPFYVDMQRFERFPWMESTLPTNALVLGQHRPVANPTRSSFLRPYNWKQGFLVDYLVEVADSVMYRLKTAPPSECDAIEARCRQVMQGLIVQGSRTVVWEKSGYDKWLYHEIEQPYGRNYVEVYLPEQVRFCPVLNVYYIAPAWRFVPGHQSLLMPRALNPSDPADRRLLPQFDGHAIYSTSKPERPVISSEEYRLREHQRKAHGAHMIYPLRYMSNGRFKDMLAADHARAVPRMTIPTQKRGDGILSVLLPGKDLETNKLYQVHGTLCLSCCSYVHVANRHLPIIKRHQSHQRIRGFQLALPARLLPLRRSSTAKIPSLMMSNVHLRATPSSYRDSIISCTGVIRTQR